MQASATLRTSLRLCALAVLSIGLFVAPAGAEPPSVGLVIAWGCSGGTPAGQCAVPIETVSGSTAIAAAENHNLALKPDGGVLAWGCGGFTDSGQCTVPAAAASGVTAIAAGFYHSLALKADGSVVAWGCHNINFGQCTVPAAAGSGVTAIAAGNYQSLAVQQGGVLAWGCTAPFADVGQCTVPAAATSGVAQVAAGNYHSLGLKQDGSVVAWGCGTSNGVSQDYGQCTVPAAAASGVTAIAAGLYHSLALKDGGVLAWGCSVNFGQCSVPAAATSGVKAIAAGVLTSVAVKEDGSVLVWGACFNGQCTVPAAAASGVTAVAAGNFHVLALRAAGDARADLSLVESASDGLQVGDTLTYDFAIANAGPQNADHVVLHDVLPLGLSFEGFGTSSGGASCTFNDLRHTLDCSWAAVASGANVHAQIRLTVNQPGPLVNPATVRSDTIDPASTNNSSTATVQVSLSPHARGIVAVWGCGGDPNSNWGQCGVPSGLSGVTAIAAGTGSSLALKSDGTVVAWGCSGIADRGQCNVPSGLSGVTAISGSTYHSLALKGDGTVVAWGCINGLDAGQCAVPALSGVTAIAAGRFHSLALKSDGTVAAWGCGPSFDLGQCVVPAGLSGVTAIAAGDYSSLALKSDGTVVAWGCSNFAPGFGPCSVPAGLQGVTAIAAGSSHSLALKSDGTVVTWGFCAGDCSAPSGLSGVTAISAGGYHSMALKSDGTVVAWGCASGGFADFGQCNVLSGLRGVTAIAAGYSQSLALIGRTVPDVPTGVSATPGNGRATLSWSAPVTDGGSAVTGYDVTRYLGGVAQGTTSLGVVTQTTVTGLTNGTAYTFKVAAKNAVGTGPRSESIAVTPRTVADAPVGVTATGGAGQATVSWSAPAFDGGSAVTGYEVTRYVGGVAQGATPVGAVTQATVTGLTNGTAYTFKVAAKNVAGTGAQSAESNPVTPRTVPDAPAGVSATAGAGQAIVNWTASATDGGGAITGYEVTRYVDGVAHGTISVGVATEATVIGLTNGTTYTFRVAAKNAAGTGAQSAESNPVTPRTVPDAPTGVSATASAGQATVSWSVPGFNGGSAITGYEVTRYAGGVAQGTNLVGAVTQTTVAGLTNGTAYTFRVAAMNAVGKGAQSAESNAVTPAVGRFTLTVAKSGTGNGTVTSSAGGINCGATCAADLDAGTTVTLTAAAGGGSTFAGWSGACSGSAACSVTLDAGKTVTATFNQVLAPVSCVVPNVKGKPLATAKRRIAAAHCKTGRVTTAKSKAVRKGSVISQSRRAGTRLAAGSKVNLVVSRGKR
jgi:uncharacterized repeat protein (TIGR01451 family)